MRLGGYGFKRALPSESCSIDLEASRRPRLLNTSPHIAATSVASVEAIEDNPSLLGSRRDLEIQ